MEEELTESAEAAQELLLDEAAEHDPNHWVRWAAITAMLLALFAAIGSLLAGMTANEALLKRTEAIVEYVNRDRDQVELEVLEAKHEILAAMGKASEGDAARIVVLEEEIETLAETSGEDELESRASMHIHEKLAIGVTLLSIAITLSGMSVAAHRKRIWHAGLAIGVVGFIIVAYAAIEFAAA